MIKLSSLIFLFLLSTFSVAEHESEEGRVQQRATYKETIESSKDYFNKHPDKVLVPIFTKNKNNTYEVDYYVVLDDVSVHEHRLVYRFDKNKNERVWALNSKISDTIFRNYKHNGEFYETVFKGIQLGLKNKDKDKFFVFNDKGDLVEAKQKSSFVITQKNNGYAGYNPFSAVVSFNTDIAPANCFT